MANTAMSGVIPFPNSGFEEGEAEWIIDKARGRVGVTIDSVPDGGQALRILTTAAENGARVTGPRVACQGPGLLEFYGSVRSVSGRSVGVQVRQFDAAGNALPSESWTELENEDGIWHRHELLLFIELEAATAAVQVAFIAYPKEGETVDLYVDDLEFVQPPLRIPPGPRQYKLRPSDTARLTPADVVGPDGVVYPNWTQVGVQGGIPEVPVALRLADMGAKPDTDISTLLEQASREVGAQGGGAILIDEGTYYLDNPIILRESGVVIRGAGREKTKLVYRYSLVQPDAKPPSAFGWPCMAVFLLKGKDLEEHEYLLAQDARRGDTTLTLVDALDLRKGDKFVLRVPDTARWQQVTNDRSQCSDWGRRLCYYEALDVRGNVVTIGQPLRIDYPAVDSACLRRMRPVERVGIEDMTIVHECRMPFYTVNSQWAWNCWVQRVDVIDCAQSGVHFHSAKWCECRDCTFTGFDAKIHVAHTNWWGYAGFTQSMDCLMEDTVWHRFRHGPQVQYGAQGCVIRNSVFHGSDAQWHAAWTTENLFENCIVDARGEYGSYGHGCYATGSNDTTHGPNGPRNVVYNCDFTSRAQGAFLCGFNENWLFLHNRFDVEQGEGFLGTFGAFDHIIRHNTFVLRDGASPLLRLKMADCTGVELSDNTLYGGNGTVYEGVPALEVECGNRVVPLGETAPDRPVADPPSIYAWQQNANT